MDMLTIPKNLIKNNDLIILPRKFYESLLRYASNHASFSKINKDLISRKSLDNKFSKKSSFALISESSLSKDWLNIEEEKAWQNL